MKIRINKLIKALIRKGIFKAKVTCVFCEKEILFNESNETKYGYCCNKCFSGFQKLGWDEGLDITKH